MSHFLFNEGITYSEPKEDPVYPYFKEEEHELSTETPFSLHSDSPSYGTSYYQIPYPSQDEEQAYPLSYSATRAPSYPLSQKTSETPKLGNTSKKIKREVAKQRTQMKQITKPMTAKEKQDQKDDEFIQEALNNPNLDEKSGKKLKQMIRNRISAQNSRDRKKAYLSNMEKNNHYLSLQNSQLIQEITVLKEANKALINEKEELKKKLLQNDSFCPHCSNGLSPSTNTHSSDEALTIPHTSDYHFDDYTRGDNGGNSPLFNRIFSGKSFLSYTFAVATILSLALLVNVTPNAQTQGMTDVTTYNKFYVAKSLQNVSTHTIEHTEIAPVIAEQPALNMNALNMNQFVAQALKSPFLQNIYELKSTFNEQAMVQFFQHLKLNEKLAPCVDETYTKLENEIEIESEAYPIVEYGFLNQALKSRSDIIRKGLAPIIGEFDGPAKTNKFSTLFCPAGFQFFDSENDDIMKKSSGNMGPQQQQQQKVLDTEYLQFYIPKRQVTAIYKNHSSNELVISPEVNSLADENTIVEVWCKVFHVRELSATINL
jgi:hypothetical protein